MKHAAVLALLALGLLTISIACDDNGNAPAATDTPAIEATATADIDPTAPPVATATLLPAAEGPCPIDDQAFCEFAEDFDRALRSGDVSFIVEHSRLESETCPGDMVVGPCVGLSEGTVLEGHFVGADRTDGGSYASPDHYRGLLQEAAQVSGEASDEYGDGTWRLAAVLDYRPDAIVLLTTTIGPDPIYERSEPERRIFSWAATTGTDGWRLGFFLTSIFVEENLTGRSFLGGELNPAWLPWGEE